MDKLPFDLELFEGRRTRPAGAPTLGIQRRGNLSLNASAFELLGEPEAVHLYYSPSSHVIAIKAVSNDTPQSYPVRKQQNARSFLIGARSFLNRYGVPFEDQQDASTFTVKLIEGMGIVELSDVPAMVPHDPAQQ